MARTGTSITLQLNEEDMNLVNYVRSGCRCAGGWPQLTISDTIRFLIRQGHQAVREKEIATGAQLDAEVGIQG